MAAKMRCRLAGGMLAKSWELSSADIQSTASSSSSRSATSMETPGVSSREARLSISARSSRSTRAGERAMAVSWRGWSWASA